MVQLNHIWKDRGIPKVKCPQIKHPQEMSHLACHGLVYGCEAWTLRKVEEDNINAAEMWCYTEDCLESSGQKNKTIKVYWKWKNFLFNNICFQKSTRES